MDTSELVIDQATVDLARQIVSEQGVWRESPGYGGQMYTMQTDRRITDDHVESMANTIVAAVSRIAELEGERDALFAERQNYADKCNENAMLQQSEAARKGCQDLLFKAESALARLKNALDGDAQPLGDGTTLRAMVQAILQDDSYPIIFADCVAEALHIALTTPTTEDA